LFANHRKDSIVAKTKSLIEYLVIEVVEEDIEKIVEF
jgi:hypothetical protein